MRWSSLVELTGDDDIANSSESEFIVLQVSLIRMSLKEYAWPSHIILCK